MRIASDGKPFDVDNMGSLSPEYIEVIQFLRPDGKRRRMALDVGKELVEMAKDMIISAEELTTGEVAVYVRVKGEPEVNETMEVAVNGPGKNSPAECLKRLIRKMADGREAKYGPE